jgi:hypothetical protein
MACSTSESKKKDGSGSWFFRTYQIMAQGRRGLELIDVSCQMSDQGPIPPDAILERAIETGAPVRVKAEARVDGQFIRFNLVDALPAMPEIKPQPVPASKAA